MDTSSSHLHEVYMGIQRHGIHNVLCQTSLGAINDAKILFRKMQVIYRALRRPDFVIHGPQHALQMFSDHWTEEIPYHGNTITLRLLQTIEGKVP